MNPSLRYPQFSLAKAKLDDQEALNELHEAYQVSQFILLEMYKNLNRTFSLGDVQKQYFVLIILVKVLVPMVSGNKPATMTVLPKKGMFQSRAKNLVTILAMSNILKRKKKFKTNMKQNKKHRKKSKIIVEDYDSKKVMAVTNLLIDTPSDESKEEIKEDDSKEVVEISNEDNITLSSDVDFVIVNE